jgi:hydrogenase expression/formation protein HypE
MSDELDFDGWVCPMPLRDHPNIVMGHGGGGKLSAELVEHLFLPAFASETLNNLGDSSILAIGEQRLAFSTDSFVVQPLFFPGGSIGDLAVNGTVNDIAMSGAKPLYLSAGFIVEEGLPINQLAAIVDDMADAARAAGVTLVAGDTKVVDKGHGDGIYINTSGIGLIPDGIHIAPQRATPGDVVIVSGTLGDHGMAIMSTREGLAFETQIQSDSVALNGMVADLLATIDDVHVLRDPTRGGVASALNEIAMTSNTGIRIYETRLPVKPPVKSACEMLGMDPLYIANEGKLIAIVPASQSKKALSVMQSHPHGSDAVIIGEVVSAHPGMLVAETALGATRVVDMQVGEQLPRIC